MSIEEIDNLMLDTQEAIEYQNQIEEALSGVLTQEDEEDIMAELEALDTGTIKLPDVPKEELPSTAETEPAKAKVKGKQPALVPA